MLSSPIHTIAHTDIYLIDQILKGRYLPGDGCLMPASGRVEICLGLWKTAWMCTLPTWM